MASLCVGTAKQHWSINVRSAGSGKTLGRPRISAAIEKRIQDRLRAGMSIVKVAREVGVGNGTVQRIADEMRRPIADAAA